MMMRKICGFTLVELLITIAIVTILATIAYPSFLEFMQKARRADAHSAITTLQLAQERLRGSCEFYALNIDGNSDGCPDTATDSSTVDVKGSSTSREGHYRLSITAANGNSYSIRAVPVDGGAQASDSDCDEITLTVDPNHPNGDRGGTSGIACWE
jgi:type IV pilus assembly protein PilE